MATRITHTKFLTGFLFILIGGVLLLKNLDLISEGFPGFLFTWPMILIIIGLFNLIGKNDISSGLILISIGLFFILPNALGVPMQEIFKFWPVLIIIAGISFLLKQNHRRKYKLLQADNSVDMDDSGMIEVASFFGGTKKVIDPVIFKGGSISSIFGGNEIDLSQCTLAEGKNYLDLNVVFGGAVIIVPAEWNVQIEITPILGGFADQRWVNPNLIKDSYSALIIRGTVIFGGGELKNR